MYHSIMKYISKFFISIKETPRQLGRWKLDYCKQKINQKIDLSNEDHCGPCGQYAIKKLEETKDSNQKMESTNPAKPTIFDNR